MATEVVRSLELISVENFQILRFPLADKKIQDFSQAAEISCADQFSAVQVFRAVGDQPMALESGAKIC